MSAPLALRDVHNTLAPSWWPLAPGWWMVIGALALIALALYALRRWRERRRRRMNEVFDRALADAATPAAEVAAMSELLRRAARRRDRDADRLQGDQWLEFLDRGSKRRDFADGVGRLLLDGGYRREVDPEQASALRELARQRFLRWMGVS
ncbi:hypothetical protein AZ78_2046 [Lysobacter capsici AZ78]|uniref:DUF4381 domain-containing protein n=2 Tax=Lysobacter capsici TaxID=435897 RepID=A0A108U8G9_9GAMM|nr:DUF4381 family protein [Lysobacter capsici]KWS04497.1 hypothetical protein AZ78_2046 [Lysobacter capsici AZ78]